MAPLLVVEDLQVWYGSVEALKGISLYLEEGEIATVLGANGAGKTTLLNAISGLLPIRAGRISFEREELNGIPPYEIVLRGISQSPEGRKVFSTLTVEENLNLGAYTRQKHTTEIAQAKERVFSLFPILQERKRQLSGTLSGGEQQMLAIGRALMAQPQLLLLDEPLLGLSPRIEAMLAQAIKDINKQTGITIVITEQYARPILPIIDYGYVLENGGAVLEGTSQDLMDNPDVKSAYFGL